MGPGAAAHLRRGRVHGLGEGGLGRLRTGVQGAPCPLEDLAGHQVLAQPARRRQVSDPGGALGRLGPGPGPGSGCSGPGVLPLSPELTPGAASWGETNCRRGRGAPTMSTRPVPAGGARGLWRARARSRTSGPGQGAPLGLLGGRVCPDVLRCPVVLPDTPRVALVFRGLQLALRLGPAPRRRVRPARDPPGRCGLRRA